MLPTAYARFAGTVTRLCDRDGSKMYDALGEHAVASGLSALVVSGSIILARAASALGVGQALNGAFDWLLQRGRRLPRALGLSRAGPEDAGISAASRVFADLNRQAGLT